MYPKYGLWLHVHWRADHTQDARPTHATCVMVVYISNLLPTQKDAAETLLYESVLKLRFPFMRLAITCVQKLQTPLSFLTNFGVGYLVMQCDKVLHSSLQRPKNSNRWQLRYCFIGRLMGAIVGWRFVDRRLRTLSLHELETRRSSGQRKKQILTISCLVGTATSG